MNRLLILALSALVLVASASDDVIVGTKDNFEGLIAKDDLTFVKFYAPWCGHCKKMADDFKQAATELKGKAVLVDLDATVEKDLAAKYEIRGFPTLKLFSKGELISDYKGGRTKDALVKYIERALLPSIVDLEDAAAITKFSKDNEGKAYCIGVALDKLSSSYKSVSMSLRDVIPDSIAFGSVSDADLVQDIVKGVKADSVILVRDDGTSVSFSGEAGDLEGWAKLGALPLFTELSRDNANLYTELDKPVFILFQDPDKKDDKVNAIIKDVATEYRSEGAVAFTWINSVELKSFQEHIGAEDDPSIAIYEFKGDMKYIFSGEFSKENLSKWVKDFVAGKLEATTKSEEIPEKNDEPVKVIVGKSWETVVEDESKDVLIEQYAPWCGHCKKLAPILDEVAEQLSGVATLVIAKMDATKNDAPTEYKAQGYPTLHFFPAGSKKGIPYTGGREKEDIVTFLKENCTHKEGIELPESEKKDDEAEDDAEDGDDETEEDDDADADDEEEKEDL